MNYKNLPHLPLYQKGSKPTNSYKFLKKQLQQLQTEFDNLTKEINETREEISSSPEGRIKELAQKWLQELTNKQLQCSREINETEKELENFITDVY